MKRSKTSLDSKESTAGLPEEKQDHDALSPQQRTASPVDESLTTPDTPSSWFATLPNLADIRHGKATKVSPVDSHHEDSADYAQTPDLASLQFCPTYSTDYARQFARAVSAAYRVNLFPGTSQKDRIFAERIVQGEGGDLVFSPAYIATEQLWNGENARLRRAALTHILGVSSADCKVEGCPYAGSMCAGCEDPVSGVFEGCRHSHENPLKLGCANCAMRTSSSACIVQGSGKDSERVYPEHILDARHDKNASHRVARSTSEMRSSKRHTVQIGPVLNNFFISRKEGTPNDFDIWMAMRKRAIDYEPEVLAMESRLARLWSSVLEDELVKQKAAGFHEAG